MLHLRSVLSLGTFAFSLLFALMLTFTLALSLTVILSLPLACLPLLPLFSLLLLPLLLMMVLALSFTLFALIRASLLCIVEIFGMRVLRVAVVLRMHRALVIRIAWSAVIALLWPHWRHLRGHVLRRRRLGHDLHPLNAHPLEVVPRFKVLESSQIRQSDVTAECSELLGLPGCSSAAYDTLFTICLGGLSCRCCEVRVADELRFEDLMAT